MSSNRSSPDLPDSATQEETRLLYQSLNYIKTQKSTLANAKRLLQKRFNHTNTEQIQQKISNLKAEIELDKTALFDKKARFQVLQLLINIALLVTTFLIALTCAVFIPAVMICIMWALFASIIITAFVPNQYNPLHKAQDWVRHLIQQPFDSIIEKDTNALNGLETEANTLQELVTIVENSTQLIKEHKEIITNIKIEIAQRESESEVQDNPTTPQTPGSLGLFGSGHEPICPVLEETTILNENSPTLFYN